MTENNSPKRVRRAAILQADVARAIRGAMQAGMDVREVIATRDGVRILSAASNSSVTSNPWDEVFDA